MRLLFVSLYFHPAARYGGPIVSSWSLCRGLAAAGVPVRVLTTDADGPGRLPGPPGWRPLAENLAVRYCRRLLGEFGAPGLLAHLPRELAGCDAVYVSGLLVWPLPALALLARAAGRPLVIAPRGMLLPRALAAKPGRKRLFLAALRATAGAAAWHATSAEEMTAVAAHFPGAHRFCLPNPVEVPDAPPAPDPTLPPYLLYLGRLHPHKQVDRILKAFARFLAAAPAPPAELRIAGGGEPGYREALAARAGELGIADRVHFLGEVHGAAKARWLASAQGLVLASKSENFGQSVAEALAHATPCVVTRTAPWPQLEERGCGFRVEEEGLAAGIGRLMALPPEERRAMGERGRDYVRSELASGSVARRMAGELERLIGGAGEGRRPPGR